MTTQKMDALRQGLLPLPSHGRGWSYVHSLKVYPYMYLI
jgi:hypothetical protein